jgi:hypothetical protein
LSAFEELVRLASEGTRRIFVAHGPIDLRRKDDENYVFVLELPTVKSGAAGGRIGGIGERKIQKLQCFQLQNRECRKIFETEDAEQLEKFELPYHAAGLSIMLPDGSEKVVTGVVDPELVDRYNGVIQSK